MSARTSGYAKYSFRPRLGALPGVDVRYLGESCEGCEVCSKNRVTNYVRTPEEIDRMKRMLAVLRSKHIDSTICAVDAGIGPLGVAIFSMVAPKARKVLLQEWFEKALDKTAQLADLT